MIVGIRFWFKADLFCLNFLFYFVLFCFVSFCCFFFVYLYSVAVIIHDGQLNIKNQFDDTRLCFFSLCTVLESESVSVSESEKVVVILTHSRTHELSRVHINKYIYIYYTCIYIYTQTYIFIFVVHIWILFDVGPASRVPASGVANARAIHYPQ